MRATRGTLTEPGKDSPYRDAHRRGEPRLLREMRDGKYRRRRARAAREDRHGLAQHQHARPGDLPHPARATHHRTGDKWCIYPMYTYAHPIEDALENITHSHLHARVRGPAPVLRLAARAAWPTAACSQRPLPQQIEFARLNLTYVVLSKRKLIQLVEEKHVDGWDDPRMPTLVGARRRGYTPEGFRLFAERIGVSKADSWIDYACSKTACART